MSTFALEIMTPYRPFFTGEVESIVIPTMEGLFGVEAGHEPTVLVVEAGILRYKVEGQWREALVTRGFAEILPHHTILLVTAAEEPGEIDLKRAEEAKARAEERLNEGRSNMEEYLSSKAALARATARIKMGKR